MDEPTREPAPPASPPADGQVPTVLPVMEPVHEPLPVLLPQLDAAVDGSVPAAAVSVRSNAVFWFVLAVGTIVYCALWFIPGEPRYFALNGIEVLPFVGLALLAYTADWYEAGRALTIGYWIILIGLAALVILALNLVLVVDLPHLREAPAGRGAAAGLFLPGGGRTLALTFTSVGLAGLLSLLAFWRPVRRAIARVTPLDPDSFVHATALATVLALTAFPLISLVMSGDPPFLAVLQRMQALGKIDGAEQDRLSLLGDRDMRIDQIYAFAWMLPVALVVVGFPIVRSLRAALLRVGLVCPTFGQFLFAVFGAGVFVVVMAIVNLKIGDLWSAMNWPTTSEKEFEQLMHAVLNPLGAVVIGVTAGLGEELVFRGVLQPRLGILLSNLFFTAMHALQYNFDALLSVFTIGLVLGIIRKLTNTTTSAIVHGLFDFTLILLAHAQVNLEDWLRQHTGM